MSALLLLLRVTAGAAVLAILALLALWAGPDAEVALAPVIARQSVTDVERLDGGRRVCWTHHYDKVREADPYDAGWTIRGAGRIYPFQRAWRIERDDPVAADIVRRPVSPGLSSRRCAEIPEALAGAPVRITGFFEYRTCATRWLWTVRQPTPEVDVP